MAEVCREEKVAEAMDEDLIQDNGEAPPGEIFVGEEGKVEEEQVLNSENTEAMVEDSTLQNEFVSVPVQMVVSWESPKEFEDQHPQNVGTNVLKSEEVQTPVVSQTDSDEVQNQIVAVEGVEGVKAEEFQIQASSQTEADEDKVDFTAHFTTDQVFDTRYDLIDWCQEVGKRLMFVVVITKSEYATQGGRKPRMYLGCERGGVFRDHKKKSDLEGRKIRRTGSKRCGCPFVLQGMKQDEGDKWKLEVRCGIHNHPIAQTPVGHSYAGRLSKEERQLVLDMSKSGVSPREVLTTIKERNRKNVSTLSTIYNTRARLRIPDIDGRTAIEELMKLVLKNRYVEFHRKDDATNEVKDIFWAYPESIQLAKIFPSVMMINCLYKDNRFKIPLFEIVGTASTGKTFSIAFLFVEAEREENFVWALSRLKTIFSPMALPEIFVTDREPALMNAITRVFPDATYLLCTIHMSRSITTQCRNYFETNQDFDKFLEDWTNLTKSVSQIEFVDRLTTFEMTWANFPDCLEYLKENFLSSFKEHFVTSWTNLLKHYGNTTINRTEGAHSRLKIYLTTSQCNFTTIWTAMQNLIVAEITDVKASFKKSLATLDSHKLDLLNEVRGHISHLALDHIAAEIFSIENFGADAVTCGCVLRQTHGLPCAHEIGQLTSEGQPIPLSSVDSHWKKLSAIPIPEIHSLLEYEPEYQQLVYRFEESNYEGRMHLLKKIKELVDPDTVWLNEDDAKEDGM